MISPNIPRTAFALAAILLTQFRAGQSAAVTVGMLDSFTEGLEGWSQGQEPIGGLGVSRVASGGPGGVGDPFMQIVAGGNGAHHGIIAFNLTAAWTGDYLAAGVNAVSMAVNNLGPSPLNLRLAFGAGFTPDSAGAWVASTNAVDLAVGRGWTNIQFPIDASAFTLVQSDGGADYNSIMSSIVAVRIVHATIPANRGASVTATLGIDDIRIVGPTAIPGDFDGNRQVDAADLAQWSLDFGVDGGSDADLDGDSDGADFLIWQQNRGIGAPLAVPTSIPAPEPESLTLVALAAAALASRRPRPAPTA